MAALFTLESQDVAHDDLQGDGKQKRPLPVRRGLFVVYVKDLLIFPVTYDGWELAPLDKLGVAVASSGPTLSHS
jgi:hypothetical protein